MDVAAGIAPVQIAQVSEMPAVAATTTKGLPWFSIQWHVTSRCDQKCVHCYDVEHGQLSKVRPAELSLPECKQVLDSLVDFCRVAKARPTACITGGDPLLRRDIFDIFSHAHDLGVPFRILGNPFHLNDQHLRRMKSLGLRSYQVSLDGLREKHDRFRSQGCFEATCAAIELLNRHGIQSIVMFTLSKANASDLIPVMDICCELGVKIFAFARYCPPTPSALDSEEFTPEEYRELLIDVDAHTKELRRQGYSTRFNRKDHLWKLLLYERGELDLTNPSRKILRGCHLGQHLNILPDGTVYACRRFQSPIGTVPAEPFLDIYVSPRMERYRRVDDMEKCKSCPLVRHCRGCPAVAFSQTGDWRSPDPQCWR